jgi:hypothetical protein
MSRIVKHPSPAPPHLGSLTGAKGSRVSRGKDVSDLDRDIAAERIAHYAALLVAEAPPLTEAQRTRIALILQGCGDTGPRPGGTDV